VDAKNRVDRMLEEGVVNSEQARRLKKSLTENDISRKEDSSTLFEKMTDKMTIRMISICALAVSLPVVFILFSIMIANTLVDAQEQVLTQRSQLDSQYQRRFDLLPQLASVVRRYLEHEKETFESVAKARVQGLQPLREAMENIGTLTNQQTRQGQKWHELQHDAGRQIRNFMIISEQYPTLRSADQFIMLQSQIEGTENRINISRLQMNRAVATYNVAIKRIPHRWIGSLMGYEAMDYFAATEGSDQAQKLSL